MNQLNRQEGWRRLAWTLFHRQRRELRQRYREVQEDQLCAIGLMLNLLVLWNTRYLDAALTQMREQGAEVRQEDVARLSPLGNTHLYLLGRYRFPEDKAILKGELRPLCQPDPMDELF
jgi:hypothetical protein